MKLYWYLQRRHADEFCQGGTMYFGHCRRYTSERLTKAQRDSEHRRAASFDPKTTRIFVGKSPQERKEVPFTSLEIARDLPDYFLRSMTLAYRASIMRRFKADACIEFTDAEHVIHAVEAAVFRQLAGGPWRVVYGPVKYVNSTQLIEQNDLVSRIMAKDRRAYSSQKEYRIALIPEHKGEYGDRLLLYLENPSAFSRRVI